MFQLWRCCVPCLFRRINEVTLEDAVRQLPFESEGRLKSNTWKHPTLFLFVYQSQPNQHDEANISLTKHPIPEQQGPVPSEGPKSLVKTGSR